MTNLTNRVIGGSIALLLCVWFSAGTRAGAQRRDVPMTADRWETVFGKAEFKEHKGAQAMVMAEEGESS
jgi:hypothetical protein